MRTSLVLGFLLSLLTPACGDPPFNAPCLPNRLATNVSVVKGSDGEYLLWSPVQKPDVLLWNVSPVSVANPGEKAEINVMWMSSGNDSCPSSDWANHGYCRNDEPCMHESVHCLAGTGDFRIGMADSSGAGYVNHSGWCDSTSYHDVSHALSSPPLNKYRAYNFRIFPHISTKADRYVPKSGSTAVPCSFEFTNEKNSVLSDERLAYNGCFEAPTGTWVKLLLTLERSSSSEMKLTMSMGSVEYSYFHHTSGDTEKKLPDKIDTILMMYPNSRHYMAAGPQS